MRVVVTCWAESAAELTAAVGRAADHLDSRQRRTPLPPHLIEARLDLLGRPPSLDDLSRVVRAARGRLLATCRPGGSGGPAGESSRLALLRHAAAAGAAAVDLEHAPAAPPARRRFGELPPGVELVVSHHEDPDGAAPAPGHVEALVSAMSSSGADVIKLAAPAGSVRAALDWSDAGAAAVPEGIGWAPVAMGREGAWLRLLAGRPRGARELSSLCYVAGGPPLPGAASLQQPSAHHALDLLGVDCVGSATLVFAVVGWPLGATWSPAVHGVLFRERRAEAILVPLPVANGSDVRGVLDELGAVGAAVTAPHKVAACRIADRVTAAVARCGSANTLRRVAGRWECDTFDGCAAADAVAAAAELRGSHVVVLGAGGAGRAATAELVARGARVTVLARRAEQAERVAADHGAAWGALDGLRDIAPDVLVNATPVGSGALAGELPVAADALRGRVAFDMVTTPASTAFLAEAARRGLAVVDGLAMFARQAAAQQAYWSPLLPGEPAGARRVEEVVRSLAGEAAGV